MRDLNLSWKALPSRVSERYCREAAVLESGAAPLTHEQRELKVQKHLRRLKIEVCNTFKMSLPTDNICGNLNYLNRFGQWRENKTMKDIFSSHVSRMRKKSKSLGTEAML